MDHTREYRYSSRAVRFAPELGSGSPSARFAAIHRRIPRLSLAARSSLRILAASSARLASIASLIAAASARAAASASGSAPRKDAVGLGVVGERIPDISAIPGGSNPERPPESLRANAGGRCIRTPPGCATSNTPLAAALPLSSRPLAVAPRETVSRATRSNVARSRASAARRAKSSRQSRSAEKVRGSSACRAATARNRAIHSGAARRSKASWNGRSGSFPRRNRSAAFGSRSSHAGRGTKLPTHSCSVLKPRHASEAESEAVSWEGGVRSVRRRRRWRARERGVDC